MQSYGPSPDEPVEEKAWAWLSEREERKVGRRAAHKDTIPCEPCAPWHDKMITS